MAWQIASPDKGSLDNWYTAPPASLSGSARGKPKVRTEFQGLSARDIGGNTLDIYLGRPLKQTIRIASPGHFHPKDIESSGGH